MEHVVVSAFKKFRRFAVISIEVIAGIGACFAFYEIFFARKTVDYASLSFDLCAPLSDQHTDFSEFLARNAEKFVVLDLDFTQRPLQCEIPGTNGWSAYLSPEQASVTLEVQSDEYGYQRVPNFGLKGYSTVLTFEASQLREHVLNDVYGEWAEDPGYISISGAFFVKPSLGEGDLYFNLIPAPFDVQTDLISRCTRVVNTQSGLIRIQQYIAECIL